jgi:serine/threonine protein kinase
VDDTGDHVFLADFGLSYFAETSKTSSGESRRDGTFRFMAPELIHPTKYGVAFKRTFASDMYAFGCVAYQVDITCQLCPGYQLTSVSPQLYTRQHPYPSIGDGELTIKIYKSELQIARPFKEDCHGVAITDDIWNLIHRCLQEDSSERPTSQDIVRALRFIQAR